MAKRVALLIDGGHLRVLVRKSAQRTYDPDYIEKVAHACAQPDEELFRIYYYDCAPFTGTAKLPISRTPNQFTGSGAWLHELASRDLFAVRLGILKFRGYVLASRPPAGQPLADNHFRPDFEQKGVDMRIGLDIATLSGLGCVDRIILITNDTDCIPAMKHGRKAGIQIVLMAFPNQRVAPELKHHADYHRPFPGWPA
ncbi:NYN domain-containing protein [Enterovirga sp. CN4-39]|uniref:NYN domain-containing protein n=1 Tax=Enterovirga sp. CN4-39 TaxID=3400910 RepID=UPI003C10A929